MLPARAIGRFVLILGFSYALLMWPWPGVQSTYASGFRAGYQLLLGSYGREGSVQFIATEGTDKVNDTGLIFRNRRTGKELWAKLSSGLGYAPAAFFTALLLATPLPLRRRARAFVWGMLLLHAVVALTLYLYIVHVFGSQPKLSTDLLSPFWQKTLGDLVRLVLTVSFYGLATATLVWALVTFRRDDIEPIMRRMVTHSATASPKR